jgi:chemotaxis protein MotA
MELGTIIGLVVANLLVALAVLKGGNAPIFFNVESILIVLGGGCVGAPLIAFPISHLKGLMGIIMKAVFVQEYKHPETIKFIVELAQKARKESLLALENVEIENEFLKKGITLAVDGTEPGTIRAILNAEKTYIQKRHEDGMAILNFVTDAAPAFGMIGTLVGLVNMLAGLSDPSTIGPAMAVAILTTLYGAMVANVVTGPISRKLEWFDKEEALEMEVVIEGINSILEGDHPASAEQKLMGFLPANQRGGE